MAKRQTDKCPECGSTDKSKLGTSYIDNTKSVDHPYHNDHMNAHICDNAWHDAPRCGDAVKVKSHGRTLKVRCAREAGHVVAGVDSNARKYEFHRGDGWVWDQKAGWREGQEPRR